MNKIPKILIVEDEIVSSLLLRKILTSNGFEISAAVTTGEEAIDHIKDQIPDIILMDIQLAGKINGIDAAQEINRFSKVPVIFITGYDDIKLKKKAMTVNPIAYLLKPVQMKTLIKLISDTCVLLH